MTLLANIEQMSPEQLDMLQKQIMHRQVSLMQQRVEFLEDKTEKLETKLSMKEQEIETLQHRMDNVDGTNIDGDKRQRLNKMIRLYAGRKGIMFDKAYKDFVQAFNMAFNTNLQLRITNYCLNRGIKDISTPEYLERSGKLDDAIRVVDKMLNRRSA